VIPLHCTGEPFYDKARAEMPGKVTQDVHAIGEQRPHRVGVYADTVVPDVRRWRKISDASEPERTKHTNE
jgi:hypothetical protein